MYAKRIERPQSEGNKKTKARSGRRSRDGGKFAGDISISLLSVDHIAEVKTRANGFASLYRWLVGRDLLALKAERADWLIVLPFKTFIQLAAAAEFAKQHSGFAEIRDPSRACPGPRARRNTWTDMQPQNRSSRNEK
jgi:hypothetical protein